MIIFLSLVTGIRPLKRRDKPFRPDIDHLFMFRKRADEWYDRISRLDPPGYDDREVEERRFCREEPELEEWEVEEEHEHLQYDRNYYRMRLRH